MEINNYKTLFKENKDHSKYQPKEGRKSSKISKLKEPPKASTKFETKFKEKCKDSSVRLKQSKIQTHSKPVKMASRRVSVGTRMTEAVKTEIRENGEGDRVLLKAEPGFGKTTFSHKIKGDWARGLFTTFSIVFFVSLKLVRPGDAIENIIIQQTPPLKE